MIIRARRPRTLLAVLAVVLPGALRRWVHVRLLGHRIDPTAHLGHSFVDVDRLEMGPGASIGHLNIIRGCERVSLDEHALIGHLNFVNAIRRDKGFFDDVERRLEVVLHPHARIMMMHFVDASDLIELHERASLTGYWTQVMTHSYDPATARQGTWPIVIGAWSLVNTRCTLLPGVRIAERCLVAAGAVVTGPLAEPLTLYGGVPAKALRTVPADIGMFVNEDVVVR
ncbi:acyltransferase [Actinomycetospora sp. C-140]